MDRGDDPTRHRLVEELPHGRGVVGEAKVGD